jgi:hypothetical protein
MNTTIKVIACIVFAVVVFLAGFVSGLVRSVQGTGASVEAAEKLSRCGTCGEYRPSVTMAVKWPGHDGDICMDCFVRYGMLSTWASCSDGDEDAQRLAGIDCSIADHIAAAYVKGLDRGRAEAGLDPL